jgi:hypothetical protein
MPGLPAKADASAVAERVTASIVFLGLASRLASPSLGAGAIRRGGHKVRVDGRREHC